MSMLEVSRKLHDFFPVIIFLSLSILTLWLENHDIFFLNMYKNPKYSWKKKLFKKHQFLVLLTLVYQLTVSSFFFIGEVKPTIEIPEFAKEASKGVENDEAMPLAVMILVPILSSGLILVILAIVCMASFEIMDLDFPLMVFVFSAAAANNAVDGGALVNGGGEGGILNVVCSDRGRIDK